MRSQRLFTAAAFFFWFAALQQPVAADPIGEVVDRDLVDLLNYMEILAERTATAEPTLPGSIRLVRLQALGECDSMPESCPMQKLYIAVSGMDESPDRKVFELPAAHGWDFKEWVRVPTTEGPDDYYVFIMEKKVVAADIASGWWSTERYQVSANTHAAMLDRLP